MSEKLDGIIENIAELIDDLKNVNPEPTVLVLIGKTNTDSHGR